LNVQRKQKRKTVLRTIRIDKELDDALYNDAQENDINENALISSILVKYVKWDRYATSCGFIIPVLNFWHNLSLRSRSSCRSGMVL